MKKKENGKRAISKITLFISALLLLSLILDSCRKDDYFKQGVGDGISPKVATAGTVVYPEIFAGPENFSPLKGKLTTQTKTLSNSNFSNYENGFYLVVKNGDGNGLNVVQGADISVNGTVVITMADFRKAPGILTCEITGLSETNTLDVQVKGKTTGVLSIWIEGVLKQDPLATFTDPRDGNVYDMVTIGTQTWMAENLAYLPSVSNSGSSTEPRYHVYGYEGTDVNAAKATANYSTYGVLYNFAGAQAAVPAGWHLPSAAEWAALEDYLVANGYNYDGSTTPEPDWNKLAKAVSARTNWQASTFVGTPGYLPLINNSSRFAALPGGHWEGYPVMTGFWSYIGQVGNWWTSTLSGINDYYDYPCAYTQQVNSNEVATWRRNNGSTVLNAFSVRCVKD